MIWKQIFTSSIGRKIIMGLSGLFLILFLIVHAGVNSCIFADLFNDADNGEMFNKAAHFMGNTVVVRILEVGLFAFIFLHIIQGLALEISNRSKRSQGYAVPMGNRGSKWYSRAMGLLGTILLLFFIIHWWHFWIPARITGHEQLIDANYRGSEMHNMYNLMKYTFSQLWVVIVYVLACISLFYHLLHGFQSAFQSLGLSHPRYTPIIKNAGVFIAVVLPVFFALIPVWMFFNQ